MQPKAYHTITETLDPFIKQMFQTYQCLFCFIIALLGFASTAHANQIDVSYPSVVPFPDYTPANPTVLPFGKPLVATGGPVYVSFVGNGGAAFNDYLFLASPNSSFTQPPRGLQPPTGYLIYNHSTALDVPVYVGTFSAGTELVFGLFVEQTFDSLLYPSEPAVFGNDVIFLTGAGARNPDSSVHAYVVAGYYGANTAYVGFEDWGDFNYTDLQFKFSGVVSLGEKAAELAQTVVGNHYLWGGKGWDYTTSKYVTSTQIGTGYTYWNPDLNSKSFGNGLDCSGLVMWSYNSAASAHDFTAGNPIGYEGAASIYAYNTSTIAEADLQPGDLLFFFNADGDNKVDHVAMYVGGSGPLDVVEAADPSRGIIYASKDALKRASSFYGFRRVDGATAPLQIIAHSPIDLEVTDPDGYTISQNTFVHGVEEPLTEISDQLYYSEYATDSNGVVSPMIIAPSLKVGDYLIRVTPKPGALPTDLYGLEVRTRGETIQIAKDVLIRDIPPAGYGIHWTGTEITQFVPTDSTPPTTTAVLSGPQNNNGWYTGIVTVTLTPTDPDGASDVAASYYGIDGGSKQTYATPFEIHGDGVHSLSFWSVDKAGNTESPHSLMIKIDSTPPSISASTDKSSLWPPDGKLVVLMVSGVISDSVSGVDASSAAFSVIDDYGQLEPSGRPALTLLPDGSFSYTFQIQLEARRDGKDADGRHYAIKISAADDAGNQNLATTILNVPHDQR